MATVLWSGNYAVTAPVVVNGTLLVASATSGQLLRLGDSLAQTLQLGLLVLGPPCIAVALFVVLLLVVAAL